MKCGLGYEGSINFSLQSAVKYVGEVPTNSRISSNLFHYLKMFLFQFSKFPIEPFECMKMKRLLAKTSMAILTKTTWETNQSRSRSIHLSLTSDICHDADAIHLIRLHSCNGFVVNESHLFQLLLFEYSWA